MVSREEVVKSVPQKGFLGILKDYYHYSSQNFGSVFLIMECGQYLFIICTTK